MLRSLCSPASLAPRMSGVVIGRDNLQVHHMIRQDTRDVSGIAARERCQWMVLRTRFAFLTILCVPSRACVHTRGVGALIPFLHAHLSAIPPRGLQNFGPRPL